MSAAVRTPPRDGDVLCDAVVMDSDGEFATLSSHAQGGMLLVFVYRGSRCAFCLRRLADYRDRIQAFEKIGVKIVALSVDTPEVSTRMKELVKLPFTLLCDSERTLISAWQLLNVREPRTASPATLLLDAALRVRFATLDDGYAAATVDDVLVHCKALMRGQKPRAQPRRVFRIPGLMWWIRGARDEWRLRTRSSRG